MLLSKKVVHRNFTKFTGKYLCQSLFFSKVAGLRFSGQRDSGTGVFLWILRQSSPISTSTPPFQVYPPFLAKISYSPHKWLKFWKVLPPNPPFIMGVGGGRSNYDLVLPYFLTISHTICQIKSFSLHFFSHLKGSIPLFYYKNKLLWYRPNNYGFASEAT